MIKRKQLVRINVFKFLLLLLPPSLFCKSGYLNSQYTHNKAWIAQNKKIMMIKSLNRCQKPDNEYHSYQTNVIISAMEWKNN